MNFLCAFALTGSADMVFDHNATIFPLTGAHIGIDCIECHINNQFEGTSTDCFACHTIDFNNSTNPNHQQLSLSTDCVTCHTSDPAWIPARFDNHNDYYPLVGSHGAISSDCAACHDDDYVNTPSECVGCHLVDFNNTANPNHTVAQFPTDCTQCHNESAWSPSSFDHDDLYPLNGAHTVIKNDCAVCHNGDYVNTPNDCVGCHLNDFNNTTNPNHASVLFPTDCIQCHNESAWEPSTFDHDGMYFPIYSGDHNGVWNQCSECHNSPNNFAQFTCIECHTNSETDEEHLGVNGYVYEDNACLACHPTGSADMVFDHNATNFPITGAHIEVDCIECHINNQYEGTSTDCFSCHTTDFSNSANPNHQQLNLSTDCATCHTTDPAWMPSRFDIHNQFYPLVGAHVSIANNCAECHNGNYVNTPNDCVGCHLDGYNGANNPNHTAAQFPTDCILCHSESAWEPSTFDHDGIYFPIYSGNHQGEWNTCNECHTNPNNYTLFSCIDCHEHNNKNEVDDDHDGVSGYSYVSSACYQCQPNGEE